VFIEVLLDDIIPIGCTVTVLGIVRFCGTLAVSDDKSVWTGFTVALGCARRITRLLESMALGAAVLVSTLLLVVILPVSAALTGADSIIAHAAASAVNVVSFGDLKDGLSGLMAFIKIVTLFVW
jgi:hypothetical protein